MKTKEQLIEEVRATYQYEGESIILGVPIFEDEYLTETFIRLPLRTFNRHGLIAGATGTGKTKTLQILAEQLSAKGVPSMVMDIKGDLSGIAAESPGHRKIDERHERIGLPFIPDTSPVQFWTLSDEKGARLRATVHEFGPVLFSKMLGLNDLQTGIMSALFQFCDHRDLPLLDLKDIKKLLQYVSNAGKEEYEEEYGRITSASSGAILRRIIEIEQQGADAFFGERSLDIEDLVRVDDGKGVVNVLRLTDIQDKPKLFSTFMLQLLAELYEQMPEVGDVDKPKFVLFIDEAHLIFETATDALLDQIEVIIKLIRSKGIGVFFITQNPRDIPGDVLSQLGMKVQHALRAFTAKDRSDIRQTAQNYPLSDYYDVERILTELGIGEALVTALDEDGAPTPVVHTYLRAPQSRMDILTKTEINNIVRDSYLVRLYNEEVDRESAYEILAGRIEDAREDLARREAEKERYKKSRSTSRRGTMSPWDHVAREMGRTVGRELTRGLFEVLGVKRRGRRSKIVLPW